MKNPKAKPEALDVMLASKIIPNLEPTQMQDLLHYLAKRGSTSERLGAAEIAFCHESHPSAFHLFMACVVPLAKKAAQKRARDSSFRSDWLFEAMYDGAVDLAIEMFQQAHPLRGIDNAFSRYLWTTLKHGTSRAFVRDESVGLRTYANIEKVRPFDKYRHASTPHHMALNSVEEQMITRQLLGQVLDYENVPGAIRATLKCIASLGPDFVLKEHAYTASGDPDKWKRERGRRPILDPDAIAKVMRITRGSVHVYLREARLVLREVFNGDGKLFQRR